MSYTNKNAIDDVNGYQPKRLFIFDLDGTIIDSLPDIHISLMNTLSHFGLPQFDINRTKELIGDGFEQLVINSMDKQNYNKEVLEYFKLEYEKHMVDKTTLIEGTKELLSVLSEKNIVCVILTNKLFSFTDKIIKFFNLDKYFNDWFGSDSFNEKKPSKLPVLKILEKYNTDKANAMIIGDNFTDIQAGINANIKTCFCEYGYGKLNGLKPDFIIKKPLDLLRIVK